MFSNCQTKTENVSKEKENQENDGKKEEQISSKVSEPEKVTKPESECRSQNDDSAKPEEVLSQNEE